jgi:hypothetical protein
VLVITDLLAEGWLPGGADRQLVHIVTNAAVDIAAAASRTRGRRPLSSTRPTVTEGRSGLQATKYDGL